MKRKQPKQPLIVSRRQLLTLMGLGMVGLQRLDPVSMITRSVLDGLVAKAQADGGFPVKNLVSILYPGAPVRWQWDMFLNPNNESIVRNGSVNNWLSQNSYSSSNPQNVAYRAELVPLPGGGSIYLPPLWNRNIPVSTGGTVPMRTLLDNTLMARGVDNQVDMGHVIGPAKILLPLGANASLTGLVGDQSETPLPVVGTTGDHNYADPIFNGYKSLKGTSPTLVRSSSNALESTLAPFIISDSTTQPHAAKLKSAQIQAAIKNAMTELAAYAKSSMPGADTLYKNYDNAAKLFQTTFGDLRNIVYPALLTKYSNLATACARTAIANILPSTGNGSYNLATGQFSNELAWQFAVAEYLLVNNLSSAISICTGGTARVAGLFNFNDEHEQPDRAASLICHSYHFLSLSAMIYELRRVLAANGMWDKTLIYVSSEYGRSPRDDGTGSDHAPGASAFTMMSGAISRPLFIGNIKADDSPTSIYRGTWGVAAPAATETGSKIITNNIAASTAAAILGVQNPLSQSSSIVAVDSSGRVTASLVESPRNV